MQRTSIFLILLIFSPGAWSMACDGFMESAGIERHSLLPDFPEILERNGINPQELKIVFDEVSGLPFPNRFRVFYKGERAGFMTLMKHWYHPEETVFIENVVLHEMLRGKGVGSLLYVVAAMFSREAGKTLFTSSDVSDEAIATWQRLEQNGLAEPLSGKIWKFRNAVFENDPDLSLIRDFLVDGR